MMRPTGSRPYQQSPVSADTQRTRHRTARETRPRRLRASSSERLHHESKPRYCREDVDRRLCRCTVELEYPTGSIELRAGIIGVWRSAGRVDEYAVRWRDIEVDLVAAGIRRQQLLERRGAVDDDRVPETVQHEITEAVELVDRPHVRSRRKDQWRVAHVGLVGPRVAHR